MQNEKLDADMNSSARFVETYMHSLSTHDHLRHCPHIVAVESNMGRESSWIEGVISRIDQPNMGPVTVLRETWNAEAKAFRSGVHTDSNVKFEAVQLLELLMNADCLRFSKNLVVSGGTGTSSADDMLEELRDQLTRWRKIPLMPRCVDGQEKFGFSAKAGPDDKISAKLQDDLVMALLLCTYWLRKYVAKELRNSHGYLS
jgi:hypothetical protein